jgi:hypothetical protein
MSQIPRYSPNPLWWWFAFKDNPNGKFCEYRDYLRLEMRHAQAYADWQEKLYFVEKDYQAVIRNHRAEIDRLKVELECLNAAIISGGAIVPDAKEVKP